MRETTNTRKRKYINQSKLPNVKIYLALLSIVVIIIYAQTTNFDFVNIDDENLIIENPIVADSSISYAEAFVKNLYSVHYKPLVFASWKAEYNLWGATPWHFHLFNWLLHLANTIILFFLGIKLFEKLYDKNLVYISAFLLAVLFTINPLRIESVAWATERKDVLFSFFFLLSWFLYIRYIQNKNYLYLIIGAIFYLLSGLSKSMGLPLILVLFLSDYWFQRKFTLKLILEKIPYLSVFILLSFLYGLLNSETPSTAIAPVLESAPEVSNQITSLAFINDLPTSIQWIVTTSLRFYLWIIHSLIPSKLSVIYSHDAIFGFWGKSIFLFPLLVTALYFILWKRRKKNLALLGGLLFFGITLSPALVLSSSGQAVFLSDRYTYIPSIGLFFILVVLLNKLNYQKNNFKIIYTLIFLFYFSISMKNISYWKNSESLFSHSIEVSPNSGLAYLNLGLYYREQNKLNKAIQVYNNGIKMDPGHYKLYSNRGKIYFDQGKTDLALSDFNKCLCIEPNFVSALANRGAIYGQKQDYEKALIDLNKALDLAPNNTNALSNRGYVYYLTQQYDKTIDDYKKFLTINANAPDIINTIGLVYNQLKEYDLALSQFTRSILLDPSKGAYYSNRSFSYFHKGNKPEALQDALKAQQLGFKINSTYLNSLKQ